MTASTPKSAIPQEGFDGYRLVRPIGRGSMGQVYLAHDTLLDRPVAVKFIGSIDPNPAQRERFFLEARAAARLQHPNVVSIYRVGEVLGHPYLISEFIRGKTLDQLPKPMRWQDALRIAQGLARGLASAHRGGVLHRDIKPANAILSEDGEAKLLDFGLAKLLETGSPAPGSGADLSRLAGHAALAETMDLPFAGPRGDPGLALLAQTLPPFAPAATEPRSASPLTPDLNQASPSATTPGAVMGTPLYMAPEIWQGEPATFRSDFYSLGALLYQLCAAHPPHDRSQIAEVREGAVKHDARPLAEVAAVEPRFAAVIDRCLRRDPADRFASADELREALEKLGTPRRISVLETENPYQGLQSFQARDRDFFFGRDGDVRAILERLREGPFTLVVGDSGVGKSSLCRAGVLPAIEEGALGPGWKTATLVPGRNPLAALSAALAPHLGLEERELARSLATAPAEIPRLLRRALNPGGGGLLVFIDQLEELLTQSHPGEAAELARVLGWLWTSGPSVRVIATLRGDFLTRLATLPGLTDSLGRALHLLRPLTREGLREAVQGPASALGVRFASEQMIQTLVDETASAEGGLPLLQFALAELWTARDKAARVIQEAALVAMGGVAGALSRHADSVLAGLTAGQREWSRRILLELVNTDRTRARRSEQELTGSDPGAKATLDALVRGRLLVAHDASSGAAVDIAHEALIRGWPTLQRWLDETIDQRAVRERVSRATIEWERLGKVGEALWRAPQLAETQRLDRSQLPPREAAFLEASRRAIRRDGRTKWLALLAIPLLALGPAARPGSTTGRRWKSRSSSGCARDRRRSRSRARACAALEEQQQTAFALFDSRQLEAAEKAWSKAFEMEAAVARQYAKASGEAETAFALDSSRADSRALLADILFERALAAEHARRFLRAG